MEINYRSILILYSIRQFRGERSIYGIFHILTGKKSSQAIADGMLYNLSFLFGISSSLTRDQVMESIQQLQNYKLISKFENNKYVITAEGSSLLQRQLQKNPFPVNLNGWVYSQIGDIFWKRLSLLIQVLSNLIHHTSQYTLIQRDERIIQWVKQYLLNNRHNRFSIATSIYEECVNCLEHASEKEAMIFVLRLTGNNRIGYTNKQISLLLNEEEHLIQMQFISSILTVINQIEIDQEQYPFLSQIVNLNQRTHFLTASTQKTYELLKEGLGIKEISVRRKLKRNTIEDHIVEIAHFKKDFNISAYVTAARQTEIRLAQQKLNTKQLKQIKQVLNTDISYFEIRLVLAKCGEKVES